MANLLEGGGDVSAVHEYLERGLGKFIYGQGIIISPSSTIKKDGQSGVGDGGAPAHPTVRCSRAKAAMIVASMSSSKMASMAAARKSLLRWSRPGRRLMMTAVNAVMTAMVPSSVAM